MKKEPLYILLSCFTTLVVVVMLCEVFMREVIARYKWVAPEQQTYLSIFIPLILGIFAMLIVAMAISNDEKPETKPEREKDESTGQSPN